MVDEKLVKLITERVVEKIRQYHTYRIPIGVSNRHVHVTKEDLEILYGPGSVSYTHLDVYKRQQ